MKLFLTLIFVILVSFLTPGFTDPNRKPAGNENPCLECHGGLLQQEFKHPFALEECTKCHKPTGKEHPGSEQGFELSDKMPQLCTSCHNDEEIKKSIHSPAAKGNCMACHSPHSSPFKKLLVADKKTMCLNCHNTSISKDNKPVVNMKQIVESRKYLHAALNGGCTSCHLPHSSGFPKLLNAAFPEGSYSPAVRDSFDLCFLCHDSDLLEKEFTTTATNFRNGEQNLHFKHIHGNKGRSCINCHDVHAADNEHLITDKVRFGKWKIPILYKPSENGGLCNTGCHAERSYTR